MVAVDTFLLLLYVLVDDFCKTRLAPERRPGPDAALSRGEVVTLAVFGQWGVFRSERGFYRYARQRLRGAFPTLPDRSQFNRLQRAHRDATAAFFVHLAAVLGAAAAPYEALDASAVPTRNAKRRGGGWLDGRADIGWSNNLGWYEGVLLLLAATPDGVLTGLGFGPASARDHQLAEAFLALRRGADPRLPTVGAPAAGPYVADKGFEGRDHHDRWRALYGAEVINPPKRNSRRPWPRALRRWLAGVRQIVETVYDKLHAAFRLRAERPHDLTGLQARLAAKAALHNFCVWLNVQLGRDRLAFADLVAW
ncbi:MAG TPA: transposase [Chloroflexota bacterium]|nr:transposase [Chloroflexota bacterium]